MKAGSGTAASRLEIQSGGSKKELEAMKAERKLLVERIELCDITIRAEIRAIEEGKAGRVDNQLANAGGGNMVCSRAAPPHEK